MKNDQRNPVLKGFTLIELLVVIGILMLIGTATYPSLSRLVLSSSQNSTNDFVVGSIRKAQGYAMDGKNGRNWGVCVVGNEVIMFSGTCATQTTSEKYVIPSTVTLTGLNEVVFSNPRGTPSTNLSIVVSTNINSNTITLNNAGGIEIN